MPDLIYLLAVLACPIAMGVMMLVMMRSGGHGKQSDAGSDAGEVTRLRAEVSRLQATQDASRGVSPGATNHTAGHPIDGSHSSTTP